MAVHTGDDEIVDPRFSRLIVGHARWQRLCTGGRWTGEPVDVPAAKSVRRSDTVNTHPPGW